MSVDFLFSLLFFAQIEGTANCCVYADGGRSEKER